jgi:transposase-like protein
LTQFHYELQFVMERDLTLDAIERLPPDAIRNIALTLSPEDINHWCRASRKFNNAICKDNSFWKNKLRQDFPKTNIENLTPEQWRYKYQQLYAEDVENRVRIEEWVEANPRLIKLRQERGLLEEEIRRLHKLTEEIREKEMKIEDEYKRKVIAMRKQAEETLKKTEKHLPRKHPIFTDLVVPALDMQARARRLGSKATAVILADLYRLGLKYMPVEGDLIGISGSEIDSLPQILIYFYKHGNRLLHDYSFNREINDYTEYELPKQILKREGSIKEISEKYGLPLEDVTVYEFESDEE